MQSIARFYPFKAKKIADNILQEILEDKKSYDDKQANELSINISNRIRIKVTEELQNTRYKVIVQTVIGKMNQQGFRFASRCLWNESTDNYVSTSYSNVSPSHFYSNQLYSNNRKSNNIPFYYSNYDL